MPDANDRLVRAARELLRWDQKLLAHKAGVSIVTIRRNETGGRIAAKTVAKITAALREAGVTFFGPQEVVRGLFEGVGLTAAARPLAEKPTSREEG